MVWEFYNFSAIQILRELKFWWIQRVNNVIYGTLEVLNFDFSNFEQFLKPQIYQNSKFRVSKIAKNDIFRPFEFTKIWFHKKKEWR